jgi:predicted small secreted protein
MRKVISLMLVLALALSITACNGGALSGTYIGSDGEQLTFSGSNSFSRVSSRGNPYSGTYSIDGDRIRFTYNDDGRSSYSSFTREGKSIIINGVTYRKK